MSYGSVQLKSAESLVMQEPMSTQNLEDLSEVKKKKKMAIENMKM